MHVIIWITVTVSVVSLATALLAVLWARAARRPSAEDTKRPPITAEPPTAPGPTRPGRSDDLVAPEPSRQHLTAMVDDAIHLSETCHAIVQALETCGEPPTPTDYARVQRYSDRLTISVGRVRDPHEGDQMRQLTDEVVTLHHCLVTEMRQHREARYPFVGARDTTLASQMLRRFDAELARLWRFARTGSVPTGNQFPVDFETVRFVPRGTPGAAPTYGGAPADPS